MAFVTTSSLLLAGTLAFGQADTGSSRPIQPAGQDGSRPSVQPESNPQDRGVQDRGVQDRDVRDRGAQPGGTVTISNVSEPVELRTLVELAVTYLDINVAMDPDLSGEVVFTQPVQVPTDEFLGLISSLLDQQGYSIYFDESTSFYNVVASDAVPVSFTGPLASTKIIRTANVRPSSLRTAIEDQIGSDKGRVTYMDDLGMMIVSGTPGQINVIERFVTYILEERALLTLTRIELEHVSAEVARARLLELVSDPLAEEAGRARLQELFGINEGFRQNQVNRDPQQQGNQGGAVAGDQLDNLGDRLLVAVGGNALLFRGRPDESAEIRELVRMIDVLPTLTELRYFTGTQTESIARYASQQGLGSVVTLGMDTQPGTPQATPGLGDDTLGKQISGGPRIVADVYGQHIVYYGTTSQQEQMASIVERFEPEQDLVVVQAYKLLHASSLDVADTINALLTNQVQTGDAPLLPGGGDPGQPDAAPIRDPSATPSGEGVVFPGGEDTFVIADEPNNQLLVKAPQKLQVEFERLIRRMDLRRPQVFLDVQILAVTWDDTTSVGVELQGMAGQAVFNTSYGLSSFGMDPITSAKTVATNLAGLTAAVVQSDQVPIIINAVQNTVDGRIVSSPKLLVDDNEEASIESVQQVPITQLNQGQNSDQLSFAGFEDAGTTLTVTPSISEGGQVRVNYDITLSDFIGEASGGIPPPRQENRVSSGAVTVPSDMTVIVGGIEVQDVSKTKVRVPLLGDIPLIGLLFGTKVDATDKTNLYVFITPRVLRDPSPVDYRLLTRGPQAVVGLDGTIPKLTPVVIPIMNPEAGSQ